MAFFTNLTLRGIKKSALTHAELDNNFTALDSGLSGLFNTINSLSGVTGNAISGLTYDNGILTITEMDGNSYSTNIPDTYITGYTYNPLDNTFTISLNDGSSKSTSINQVSGLTVTNGLDVQGSLYNSTGLLTLNSDVLINGNVNIIGTATTINTQTLSVEDNVITLNSNVISGTPILNAGIEVLRGDEPKAELIWNETLDRWELGTSGNTSQIITEANFYDFDTFVTGFTFNTNTYDLTISQNDGSSITNSLSAITNDYVLGWSKERELGNTITVGRGIGRLSLVSGSSIVNGIGTDFTNTTNFDSPAYYYEATIVLKDGTRRYLTFNGFTGSTIAEINGVYTDTNYTNLIGTTWDLSDGEYEFYSYNIGSAIGELSHVEGYNSTSIGFGSHAEGHTTKAIGDYSHAEGVNTSAYGRASHAEGERNIASGIASHAEGGRRSGNIGITFAPTSATTYSAHAEGAGTLASGEASHAEGYFTVASGIRSHAQGNYTLSNGTASHAEGNSSIASNTGAHAEGGSTVASGEYSHAEGIQTVASSDGTHAGGFNSVASGVYSFVHGDNSMAGGLNTVVFGRNITGTTDNTTYVDGFNIKTLSTGTTIGNLGIDVNGYVTQGLPMIDTGNRWFIPSGTTVTIQNGYQSFIYGDLIIEGTIDTQTDGQLVVFNGDLILSGGSIVGSGSTSVISLPSVIASKYVETVSLSAGVPYTITHNLNEDISVDVKDLTLNEKINVFINNYTTTTVDITSTSNVTSARIIIIG